MISQIEKKDPDPDQANKAGIEKTPEKSKPSESNSNPDKN